MPATITALPTPPSRSAPATFSERADAFLAALPTFVTEANALAADVEALAAALAAPGLTATSATSLTVGTGSKSLTVQTGKSFVPGMSVKIAYTTTPTTWMHGIVTSYNSGTGALEVEVLAISGSGTQAAWTVSISAPILNTRRLVNKTQADSPYTVTASDLDGFAVCTNTGATGEVVFQLPAGSDSYTFEAIVTAAQYLKILANGTETIRYLATQSAAGGYVRSNVVGNTIQGKWSGTEWVITGLGGAWTYDS